MFCVHDMPQLACPICRPKTATAIGTPPWLRGIFYSAERNIVTLRAAIPTPMGVEQMIDFECTPDELNALRGALDKAEAARVAASKVVDVAAC